MSDTSSQRPKKRRISRACDFCHQRSKRCRTSNSSQPCQNCAAFDQPCTFDRPKKRRGAPRRNNDGDQALVPQRQGQVDHTHRSGAATARRSRADQPTNPDQTESHDAPELSAAASNVVGSMPTRSWQAPRHYDHAVVMDLVELFFEIVYPMFPLFHQPSFIRRISRTEYTSDCSLFSVTMAVCALVSGRVRDGAVFNPRWNVNSLQNPRPDVYYMEAIEQLSGKESSSDINTLRAHAILALAAIQDGKIRDMHRHLGMYHSIVATEGLHDESNWPKEVGVVEMEERRRLFWSIYTLDVFTSIVWGGVIRSREYQSTVSYPSEADDDMFDDAGFASTALPGSEQLGACDVGWMAGRNFVTDLYRVLEQIMMRLSVRKSRAQRETLIDKVLQASDSLSQEAVLNSVMQMYDNLPQCLKATNPVTSKPRLDRFGFQAADIIATVQLLRMVLLSATGASISERCQIANEVVTAFIAIPSAYQKAISVPLLFHLGVIGQILATTLEQPLSETDYNSIRTVMLAMVQLLSTLEGLHASKGASHRLKHHITRIDEYMTLQRHSARAKHGRPAPMNSTPQLVQETWQEMPSSAFGSRGIDEALSLSPFQLPSEILGDFSQIFDFSHLS